MLKYQFFINWTCCIFQCTFQYLTTIFELWRLQWVIKSKFCWTVQLKQQHLDSGTKYHGGGQNHVWSCCSRKRKVCSTQDKAAISKPSNSYLALQLLWNQSIYNSKAHNLHFILCISNFSFLPFFQYPFLSSPNILPLVSLLSNKCCTCCQS